MPKHLGGMGFRDIELFNLALLAKQAWRILQDPASLSAHILKALYYPQGDFLSATLGSTPSWIWRSLLDGREVLQQGLIRRIGSSETTSIWSMDWLPTDSMRQPVPSSAQHPPHLVSELINHTSAT
jgi:hypothetical protein